MGRKTVSCNGVEATRSSSEEGPRRTRRQERRRPADDSEQMVNRRYGQAPGPATITWPCMHAGRREFQPAGRWRIAGGASEVSCSLFPPLHGHGRHSESPRATTKHPATAWSTTTRRCKFTRRLARLIAVIGDLPATSAFSYHLSSAHAPGPRLLPRRVRRGGTDHEARRAFGTLQRALEHAARISSGPMIRVNGDEPPDTACTRVLNAIT
jgi:hypothetical protein